MGVRELGVNFLGNKWRGSCSAARSGRHPDPGSKSNVHNKNRLSTVFHFPH